MFIGRCFAIRYTEVVEDPPLNIIMWSLYLELAGWGGMVVGLVSGILSSLVLGFLMFTRFFRPPEAIASVHEKLRFFNRRSMKSRLIYLLIEILLATSAGPIGCLFLPDAVEIRGVRVLGVWVMMLIGKLFLVALGAPWRLFKATREPAATPLLGRWADAAGLPPSKL